MANDIVKSIVFNDLDYGNYQVKIENTIQGVSLTINPGDIRRTIPGYEIEEPGIYDVTIKEEFNDIVLNFYGAEKEVNHEVGKFVYKPEKLTNANVVVTLDLKEFVQITNPSDGTNRHTFEENGEFTFEYIDQNGKEGQMIATVDWIDKTKPTAEVTYSTTDTTRNSVTVTIVPSKECICTNTPNGAFSKVFDDNGTFTFELLDNAGNIGYVDSIVDWIDKQAPVGEIKYSTTSPTSKAVIATLTCEEQITVTNNNGSNKYEFSENGEFIFEFKDLAGNKSTAKAKVENITKEPPKGSITYSTTSATNEVVIATLVTDRPVTITNPSSGSNTYTFVDNGTFTFNFVDEAENEGSTTAKVTWIDRQAPTASITYSTTQMTENPVIATLVPNEPIIVTKPTDGSYNHTFTKNGTFTFEFKDVSGNTGTATATVNNIDEPAPVITILAYVTEQTSDPITVTATTTTGTLNETQHTFTSNGSFTFVATTTGGKTTSKTVTITNITPNILDKPIYLVELPEVGKTKFVSFQIPIYEKESDSGDDLQIAYISFNGLEKRKLGVNYKSDTTGNWYIDLDVYEVSGVYDGLPISGDLWYGLIQSDIRIYSKGTINKNGVKYHNFEMRIDQKNTNYTVISEISMSFFLNDTLEWSKDYTLKLNTVVIVPDKPEIEEELDSSKLYFNVAKFDSKEGFPFDFNKWYPVNKIKGVVVGYKTLVELTDNLMNYDINTDTPTEHVDIADYDNAYERQTLIRFAYIQDVKKRTVIALNELKALIKLLNRADKEVMSFISPKKYCYVNKLRIVQCKNSELLYQLNVFEDCCTKHRISDCMRDTMDYGRHNARPYKRTEREFGVDDYYIKYKTHNSLFTLEKSVTGIPGAIDWHSCTPIKEVKQINISSLNAKQNKIIIQTDYRQKSILSEDITKADMSVINCLGIQTTDIPRILISIPHLGVNIDTYNGFSVKIGDKIKYSNASWALLEFELDATTKDTPVQVFNNKGKLIHEFKINFTKNSNTFPIPNIKELDNKFVPGKKVNFCYYKLSHNIQKGDEYGYFNNNIFYPVKHLPDMKLSRGTDIHFTPFMRNSIYEVNSLYRHEDNYVQAYENEIIPNTLKSNDLSNNIVINFDFNYINSDGFIEFPTKFEYQNNSKGYFAKCFSGLDYSKFEEDIKGETGAIDIVVRDINTNKVIPFSGVCYDEGKFAVQEIDVSKKYIMYSTYLHNKCFALNKPGYICELVYKGTTEVLSSFKVEFTD